MQNTAIVSEKDPVTFDSRPKLHWKFLSDSEIKSCLEEAGQVGYRISIIF